MASIDFLHDGIPFSGATLRSASMGGTESSIVQLAEALAVRGHDVRVFNGMREIVHEFGVGWYPLSEVHSSARADVGIAVASPRVFRGLRFRVPILWLHNPTTLWRQIKRGNMVELIRTQPHAVLLGQHHDAHVPRLLPYRSRSIIHHGVHSDFIRRDPALTVPAPRALFTSQPYRGLDWLLDLWPEVRAQVPDAELHVFAPKDHQASANAARDADAGVIYRGSVSGPELAAELRRARAQLIPGHYDETFCLAAAEAIAMGVPVVTRGIGALSERVRDGETGFIAPDREAYVARTVALLSDDRVWIAMHTASITESAPATWDALAAEWETNINFDFSSFSHLK